jgi:hypothetical protein
MGITGDEATYAEQGVYKPNENGSLKIEAVIEPNGTCHLNINKQNLVGKWESRLIHFVVHKMSEQGFNGTNSAPPVQNSQPNLKPPNKPTPRF